MPLLGGVGVVHGYQLLPTPLPQVSRDSNSRELLEAARAGDVNAQRRLGRMLIEGTLIKRDVANGVKWLIKAAEQGDSGACLMLGDLYSQGRGVAQNERKAAEFYVLADAAGNKHAAKRLEKMPMAYAPEWWEKRADSMNKKALLRVMIAYAKGEEGFDRNVDKAREYYKSAHEKWPSDTDKMVESLPAQIKDKLMSEEEEDEKPTVASTPEPEPEKSPEERLCHAALEGDLATVRKLLRDGTSANAVASGGTPALHYAAMSLDGEVVVKALLEAGANANSKNAAGLTPLFFACINGKENTRIVRMLLKAGANVNAKSDDGETPLMIAACTGKEAVVNILLEHKADVNVIASGEGIAYLGCSKVDSDFSAPYSALTIAHCKSFSKIVAALIRAGADVNIKYQGNPLFFYYCGDSSMLQLFLKHGCNINAVDDEGNSALIRALDDGDADIAKRLVKAGVNVNVQHSETKISPLMCAAFNGPDDLFNLILSKNPDIHAVNDDGATALHFAALAGKADYVSMLLKKGAKMDAVTPNGMTAEQMARNNGHTEVADLLAEKARAKDKTDDAGSEPVAGAATKKNNLMLYIGIGGGVLLVVVVAVVIVLCRKKKSASQSPTPDKTDEATPAELTTPPPFIPAESATPPPFIPAESAPAMPPPPVPAASAEPAMPPPPVPAASAEPAMPPPPVPAAFAEPAMPPPPVPAASVEPTMPPPPVPPAMQRADVRRYLVCLRDGSRLGPFTQHELKTQVSAGMLPPDVMVWAEGMPVWMPVYQVLP